MYRLFVAVDIPDSAKEAISFISCGIPGARWVDKEHIHLTLRFIGDVDGRVLKEIQDAFSEIKMKPFTLVINGVGFFPPRQEPRILWTGIEKNEELSRLRNKVENILVRLGLPPEERKFSPHITIARLRDTPVERAGRYLSEHGLFKLEPFEVNEFHLYSSTLNSKGPKHIKEASWPLSS